MGLDVKNKTDKEASSPVAHLLIREPWVIYSTVLNVFS